MAERKREGCACAILAALERREAEKRKVETAGGEKKDVTMSWRMIEEEVALEGIGRQQLPSLLTGSHVNASLSQHDKQPLVSLSRSDSVVERSRLSQALQNIFQLTPRSDGR